jgi:protein-disulfide isomerase
MKKILLSLLVLLVTFNTKIVADNLLPVERIVEGNKNAKVTIITFESLTCSHCADFHKNVYPQLKKEFIDTGLVKIEFRHFPLDLAALNASKISQCTNNGKSEILHFLFLNQENWTKGQTIEEINKDLKKLLKEKYTSLDFKKCINNKNVEDFILNDRIEGVQKFKVNATPTIIINTKKFDKQLNYKNLKKIIKKLI